VVLGLALPPLAVLRLVYGVRRVRRRCYLLQIVVSLVLLDLALPQYWLRHLTSTSTGDAASYDRDFCWFR
jgi:hypothetical protein